MSDNQDDKEAWRIDLPLREQAFVEEYLRDLNASAAMKRCGVKSDKTAAEQGSRYLRKPRVDKAIKMLFESRGISKLRILEEYAKIAFANIDDYVKVKDDGHGLRVEVTASDKLTRDQLAAIGEIVETVNEDGSVSIKVKPSDKQSALAYLGKAMGAFVERKEISGPNGGAIKTQDDSYTLLCNMLGLDNEAEEGHGASEPLPPPNG